MKTRHLVIITGSVIVLFVIIGVFLFFNQSQKMQTGVEIQDIIVKPTPVKVGNTFTVSATLVNNLQNTIYVNVSPCRNTLSVHFDNHVAIDAKNIPCEDILGKRIVNPGENFTISYPDYSNDFRAITLGTSNATVSLYYFENNQATYSKTISKSFLFTISN